MKGRKIFGKLSVHAAFWQLALVSIVTVALLDRVVSISGSSTIA
jgi:hypothetical protein